MVTEIALHLKNARAFTLMNQRAFTLTNERVFSVMNKRAFTLMNEIKFIGDGSSLMNEAPSAPGCIYTCLCVFTHIHTRICIRVHIGAHVYGCVYMYQFICKPMGWLRSVGSIKL